MTLRAVVIGLLLGVLVAGFTFFNDFVIKQTFLVANHFPVAIFGALVVVLLTVNPLLWLIRASAPLRGGELAVVVLLGSIGAFWPGFGFFRSFVANTAVPQTMLPLRADWQAQAVMSYLPGVTGELGEGHVRDWQVLGTALRQSADEASSPLRPFWDALPVEERDRLLRTGPEDRVDWRELWHALNKALHDPGIADSQVLRSLELSEEGRAWLAKSEQGPLDDHGVTFLNRWLLVAAASGVPRASGAPGLVSPPPPGHGVLFMDGRNTPELAALRQGDKDQRWLLPWEIPWAAWFPTLALWGGLALIMSGVAICMALIVHPQWSRHELLAYPIARFVELISQRESGRALPDLMRSKLFLVGLLAMVALHGINGLHAWYPAIPEIKTQLDFSALTELFPNAKQVYGNWAYFKPTVYPTVIAFALFLSTEIAFSLGISHLLFIIAGAFLLRFGISVKHGDLVPGGPEMLQLGAYLGVALTMFYTARHYLARLVLESSWLSNQRQTPRYAVWALRLLALFTIAGVLILRSVGVPATLAALFLGLMMLMYLVLSRVVAESGLFFAQTSWQPVGVLVSLMGIEVVGPTAFLVLALASVTVLADMRTLLMPYVVNGLRMAQIDPQARPGRLTPWMTLMLIGGFAVAALAALTIQHSKGLGVLDNWSGRSVPPMAFNTGRRMLAELSASGQSAQATTFQLSDLLTLSPAPEAWMVLVGVGLVLLFMFARLRIPGWPLHPLIFVVWDTYPIYCFAASFLIGWAIKLAVVRGGGARGYRSVLPLAVGVIAGELLMALFWTLVGTGYFCFTGMEPNLYRLFP
ncbi:MAG: DUF6785 family protein [Phycisphaeraceae bacterium]